MVLPVVAFTVTPNFAVVSATKNTLKWLKCLYAFHFTFVLSETLGVTLK